MGLFGNFGAKSGSSKETCAICGGKKGLLGIKLGDGTCLCGDCWSEVCLSGDYYLDNPVESFENYKIKAAEKQAVHDPERKAVFTVTREFFNTIFVDDEHELIMFEDFQISKNKIAKNADPMIFRLEDICFVSLDENKFEMKNGLLSGKYARMYSTIAVGFKNSFADLVIKKIEYDREGKGVITTTLLANEDVDTLIELCNTYIKQNTLSQDSYLAKFSKAVDKKAMDPKEAKSRLDFMFSGNKAEIKAAKKKYGIII